MAVQKSAVSDGLDYLLTGSRDGTLKKWALSEDSASCSATFESHVDWVMFFTLYPKFHFWLPLVDLGAH